MKRLLVFAITAICFCSACQKGSGESTIEVGDNLLVGKWQFEKVEYYELTDSGAPVFINAESEPEYKELNYSHRLEFTSSIASLWVNDKSPRVMTTYIISDGVKYWKDNKGIIYTDKYLMREDDVLDIYILNKNELALILEYDELEFGSTNWEDFHYACPVMFYRRVK